jgi:hypothetical protein
MSARKFTDEAAIKAITNKNNRSVKAVLRELNGSESSGSNYQVIYSIVKKYKLDTSHWLGKRLNILFRGVRTKSDKDFFIENSPSKSHVVRLRLLQDGHKKKQCESCENTHWMNKEIPLEVHHVNGDNTDNRLSNLQILCPNCHAQTPTYKIKNFGRMG